MNSMQLGARLIRALGGTGALALVLLLCACAGVLPGIPPKLEGIKSVGIVSAMGDRFTVQNVGLTVFGNDSKEFPIDSWGIDDLVASRTRALLRRRFAVRPVTYQRSAFSSPNSSIASMVREGITPAGVDAYIVIGRGVSKVGATNQFVTGIGILEIGGSLLQSEKYFLHALYALYIFDGRDFSKMASTAGLLPGESLVDPIRTTVLRGPHREVDKSWVPTSLDAGSNQRLKSAVAELID